MGEKPETAENRELKFQTEKQFVGYEEGDNPMLEPLFANHFEFVVLGSDIFLDIGVILPEDVTRQARSMAPAAQELGSLKVKFHVLYRIAMSAATFSRFHQNMTATFEAVKARIKQDAQTTTD